MRIVSIFIEPIVLINHCLAIITGGLSLLIAAPSAYAGLDDCLSAAYAAASPDDMKKAAKFAVDHYTCLPNLVPPKLVPYVAISGAVDGANKSGALAEVKLDFGNSYATCVAKLNPGAIAIKQLSSILKPICKQPGLSTVLNCGDLEGAAADEVNAQIVSKVPILDLLPCACAAATSGLGVEKIKKLVDETKKCGAAIAKVGEYLAAGAKGAYKQGKKVVNKIEDGAETAGCAVLSTFGGGCSKAVPPNGIHEAEKFCKAQGSTPKATSTKTNSPADYSVVCHNQAACMATPGKKPSCRTAVEYQAHQEKTRTQNEAWCNNRRDDLKATTDAKCHDNTCRTGVAFVTSSIAAACIQYANNSKDPWGDPTLNSAEQWPGNNDPKYRTSLDNLVKESIIRDPRADRVSILMAHGCRPFLGREREMLCPKGVAFDACKPYIDKNQMRVCFEAGNNQTRYANKLMDDPNADLATRLSLYGCNPFLGRAGQYLCSEQKGHEMCLALIAKGTVRECRMAGTKASTTNQPAKPNAALVAPAPVVVKTQSPAASGMPGCKPFLGRAGEWLCSDDASLAGCDSALKLGKAKSCRAPNSLKRP